MVARVGFLGLGIMGRQMALRCLQKNVPVLVWNRSPGALEPLVAAGAQAAASPAEVVSSCDFTHAMLSDPAASEAVCFGDQGVLSTAGERTAFIDHSTIDEATGVRISKALTSKGARYLSAPVSGGWRDAAKGELLFICGGDRAVFDASTADGGAMAAMGERHWLVSESPAGAARAKLMLQIMMGSMIGALGETLALTKRADLDPTQIMEMFNASAMANPICAAKGKLMIEGKYDPNFQVYLQQKDLRLAMQLADDMGMPAPISAAVNAQYIAARQRGLADADFAAIHASYDPPTQREN